MDYAKYLTKVGIEGEQLQQAIDSINEAKNLYDKEVKPYKNKAPFVWAKLARSLPWEADTVPPGYEHYDNDVSINGDAWAQKQPDGTWVTIRAKGVPNCIQYFHPDYTGDAYYAKGHHPRSPWARWIWNGIRNRASAAAMNAGPVTDTSDIQKFGDPETSKSHPGIYVHRMGKYWQLYVCEKVFFGLFVVRRNVGFKINNSLDSDKPRAAVVYIPWSLLRAKEG